ERPGPGALRDLRGRRGHFRHPRPGPPRDRLRGAPLFAAAAPLAPARRLARDRGPPGRVPNLCLGPPPLAIAAAARALPGDLQSRLLPGALRGVPVGGARVRAGTPRCLRAARGSVPLMQTGGLWMLAAVAVLMVATGLPAWIVLVGVSLAF